MISTKWVDEEARRIILIKYNKIMGLLEYFFNISDHPNQILTDSSTTQPLIFN